MMNDCSHINATVESRGSYHFSAGDVWDDIEEYVVCTDCGEILFDEGDNDEDQWNNLCEHVQVC